MSGATSITLKQLNFRYFNTNGKKFTVTVNFIQKETKSAPKLSGSSPKIIRTFPIFPKIFRRLRKISKENSENVSTIYQGQTVHSSLRQGKEVSKRDVIDIFTCERYIFYSVKTEFFSVRETLVIH